MTKTIKFTCIQPRVYEAKLSDSYTDTWMFDDLQINLIIGSIILNLILVMLIQQHAMTAFLLPS